MNFTVIWDLTPCSLVDICRRLWGTCCLLLPLHWRLSQHVPPKRRQISSRQCGVTAQVTMNFIFTSLRTAVITFRVSAVNCVLRTKILCHKVHIRVGSTCTGRHFGETGYSFVQYVTSVAIVMKISSLCCVFRFTSSWLCHRYFHWWLPAAGSSKALVTTNEATWCRNPVEHSINFRHP
jgi:hypothetical protein